MLISANGRIALHRIDCRGVRARNPLARKKINTKIRDIPEHWWYPMPYRWRREYDVDETIVVIRNSMERGDQFPEWLSRTVQAALSLSEPPLIEYFYTQLARFAPEAVKHFRKADGRMEGIPQ
jgi:hypothetical protein